MAGDDPLMNVAPGTPARPSSLTLFVTGIRRANHVHAPVTTDDLAILADSLDARTNLHFNLSSCWTYLSPLRTGRRKDYKQSPADVSSD